MLKKLRRMNKWDAPTARRVMTLWLCAGDRRAGRLPRIVARAAALYAYSPIDLIPDFLPFIGHLDDLLVIPLAARLVQRQVPATVWNEAEEQAARWVTERGPAAKPKGVRIALWSFAAALLFLLAAALFGIWVLYQVLVLPRE